jgi:hypothetical protein
MKDKGIKLTVKKYKQLGTKKFFKKWGEGIEGITPLQNTRTVLISLIVMILGVVYGFIFTLLFTRTYWLSVILGASLPITFMQFVSAYQKYVKLKEVEKIMKELDNQVNQEIIENKELIC